MTRYVDPTTLGLLSADTNEVPAHAVELTDEQYEQIKFNLSAGLQLGAVSDGNLVMSPPRLPRGAERAGMIRGERGQAYMLESEPLKLEAEADAIESATALDYEPWLAARAAIRERLPLPGEELSL